ncbi:hypothetical protein LCGC14_0569380 [marine sediment metagenome]|uniref:Uncharacterized protein n=1 Tax=marine sediment metagenome TaxID=412755 RepID=A0A0F9RPN7_9ZZZZ
MKRTRSKPKDKPVEKKSRALFDMPTWQENEWQGMPEFVQEDLTLHSLVVHFQTKEDIEAFSKLVDQQITSKTKFIWYPKVTQEQLEKLRFVDEEE